jgi:hypothetical protein
MIARVAIYERQELAADRRVYNLVYMRQAEGVLRAVFVEISIINAHSPFFILLTYKN